jgi:class 3 adenylate cyclase
MALKEDIESKISSYFRENYQIERTQIVPSTEYSKLTFGNKGLVSELAFLFVDIRKSSKLHEVYGYDTAARIYQSFHDINIRIINHFNGQIRAFDGDRTMGVFSGDSKCTNAVKSAMKIRWAVNKILNTNLSTNIRIGAGVEFGDTLITKVGKGRDINNQDLIWVGEACNFASHYCQEANQSVIISQKTYDRMHESCKYDGESKNMWKYKTVALKNGELINLIETTYIWEI